MKTAVLRDVTSQELVAFVFKVQEIPKISSRKIREHIPDYTAAYSRTLDLSISLSCKFILFDKPNLGRSDKRVVSFFSLIFSFSDTHYASAILLCSVPHPIEHISSSENYPMIVSFLYNLARHKPPVIFLDEHRVPINWKRKLPATSYLGGQPTYYGRVVAEKAQPPSVDRGGMLLRHFQFISVATNFCRFFTDLSNRTFLI